jgi:hypothetical protein
MGRRCCCTAGCELGDDNFDDRDDGAVPSDDSKWKVLAGTWEFDTGTVKSTSTGILATRICHPAVYPLGSFVATFKLVDPEDGKEYKVRAGHPVDSDYEVHFLIVGDGVNRIVRVTVYGDVTETLDYPWDEAFGDAEATVCYAPNVELSAHLGVGSIRTTACAGCDDCDRCYTVSSTQVGNFSFLEGHFDDWAYEVHFLENEDCKACDCFCYQKVGNVRTLRCIPKEITLLLTNVLYCSGLEGDYTLYQRSDGGGFPDNTEKYTWISDETDCTNPAKLRFILTCQYNLDGDIHGAFTLAVMKIGGAEVEFDFTDPDTIGDDGVGNSVARNKATSTCDPISLDFPDLTEATVSGGFRNYCCGEDHEDDPDTKPRVSVEVTL